MEKELTFQRCGSGFFSCCNIILMNIIDYFNTHHKLPEKINTEKMFAVYQFFENQDIFTHCFYEKEITIEYIDNIYFCESKEEAQFSNYKLLNYHSLEPFIEKYYNITEIIQNRIIELKEKYGLKEQKDLCGVFYRGNDKVKETQKPPYEEIIEKANSFKEQNPDLRFLVQTDENDFLQYFLSIYPDSIFFQEIPTINQQMTTVAEIYRNNSNKLELLEYYIASIFILSQLENVICTSGNGELFMCLFRKNAIGIHQYLKKNEIIHGSYNKDFNPNETNFWF